MKGKIFIADYTFNTEPKVSKKRWKEFGKKFQIIRHKFKRLLTRKEVFLYSKECMGIIAGVEKVYDEEFFKKFPQIKCISRTGAGMDNIDLESAAKYGVVIKNCPEAVMEAAAELSVAIVLSLLRKIPMADSEMKKGVWNQFHGNLLQGKTVGIIGVGRIGKRVASLMKPFNCTIVGNDLTPDTLWFKNNDIQHLSKTELYKKCDVVCFHPSMLPENWHLVSDKEFSSMKDGVLIVNLSRGPIIDEKALIKYLKKGKVAGAALDVFEKEPYKGKL